MGKPPSRRREPLCLSFTAFLTIHVNGQKASALSMAEGLLLSIRSKLYAPVPERVRLYTLSSCRDQFEACRGGRNEAFTQKGVRNFTFGARFLLLGPFLWMMVAGGAFAQQQERIVSPEVNADRRVTIRFRAPGAKEVAVRMDGFLKTIADDEGRAWRLECDDRSALAGLLRLLDRHGRSPVDRPEQSFARPEGKGIHVQWVETDGAHWWSVWRRNLVNFVPELFQGN